MKYEYSTVIYMAFWWVALALAPSLSLALSPALAPTPIVSPAPTLNPCKYSFPHLAVASSMPRTEMIVVMSIINSEVYNVSFLTSLSTSILHTISIGGNFRLGDFFQLQVFILVKFIHLVGSILCCELCILIMSQYRPFRRQSRIYYAVK